MSKVSNMAWKTTYTKNVEKSYAETYWPVYEPDVYQLRGKEGFRYVQAVVPSGELLLGPVRLVDPFSPEYADLFLKFARWFDDQKMDKATKAQSQYVSTLDTERNAAAALAWTRKYGMLGLGKDPNFSLAVGAYSPASTEIAARRLGKPQLGRHGIRRQYRKSDEGGEHETVERFVLEAYEANIVLKLYTAATAKAFKEHGIARFMSGESSYYKSSGEFPAKYGSSEREIYSQNREMARSWALRVVEGAVNRKVERDVYPILIREAASHKDECYEYYTEGWGFKSLLGAMWFQMRMFMLGDERYGQCLRCNESFYKNRRDKIYCSGTCSNRASSARDYERKRRR